MAFLAPLLDLELSLLLVMMLRIPNTDPAAAEWKHADGCALVRGRGERAESSSLAMSAMMAVIKLLTQREDTYAQVMVAVRQTQEMQWKAERRARKFRKQARLLEQAQKDRNDWEDIAEYRRQQWVKAIRERDHKQDQMGQLAREGHSAGALGANHS